MSDVSVALTTYGYLIASSGTEKDETLLWRSNLPVCVADMGAFIIGDTETMAEIEKSIISMAATVHVDPEKKYVFIGVDPSVEDTGLVIYTEEGDKACAREFFKRWVETKSMFFQFRLMFGSKVHFAMKGLWADGKWLSLAKVVKGFIEIETGAPL